MNKVICIGRLTKEADLKYTQSGIAVARFTLAVQRNFSNAQGEYEADFIQVVVWRKQAENVATYTGKGSLVAIDGRLQTGSYEKDGRTVWTTEVVADQVKFLDSKKKEYQEDNGGDPFQYAGKPIELPDDLPF
jgi:single-strand DNA-binding protein